MDEQLCRVEITKDSRKDEYVAKVYSEYEGIKEFRSRNLEHLLRELSVDLEFSFGESIRREEVEPPPNFEEEAGYPGEEKF